MSSLVAAGVPATVRGQVARSLLPPCSDRPPLPQRAHSLGEIADHLLHFLFLSSPAENGSNLCLLRNFPRCLPWYIPLPIPQFSTSGSSPPEARDSQMAAGKPRPPSAPALQTRLAITGSARPAAHCARIRKFYLISNAPRELDI